MITPNFQLPTPKGFPPPMRELEEKVERLTRVAHEHHVGGILIQSQPGFAWLTGGGSNRIDGSRENGNGTLFVRGDGRRFVIANAIEMPRLLDEELSRGGWEPIEYAWTDEHAQPDTIARLAQRAAEQPAIGADIAIPGTTALDRPLVRARALLTPEEVERYRALGADCGSAIGSLARSLEPGLEESAVAHMIQAAAAAIDAQAVVVLVAADERIAKYRHPVPTGLRWRRLLLLVACIRRGGLTVALSRMVSVGPPPPNLAARTAANAAVFGRLLGATVPATDGRTLFHIAERAYADVGFRGEEQKHHQGGAIGYRSREWVAHPASEEVVQERQAFAWNPSITGTKVEDTALVTERGIELISSSPGWPSLEAGAAGILVL